MHFIVLCHSLYSCLVTRYLSPTAQSTNPFVAAGVPPAAAPTNPFQSNGRTANMAAAAVAAGVFMCTFVCVLECVAHIVHPPINLLSAVVQIKIFFMWKKNVGVIVQ